MCGKFLCVCVCVWQVGVCVCVRGGMWPDGVCVRRRMWVCGHADGVCVHVCEGEGGMWV